MYEFTRGPLVLIAFAVFIFGSIYRIVSTIREAKKEGVVLPYMDLKYGARSILHWIVPFGSRSMRLHPVFTVLSFLFHLSLLASPFFVLAHNILCRSSWGVSLWSLPDTVSDAMAVVVVVIGVVLLLRRVVNPTVRFVTSAADYVFLAIVVAPFITGILAYHQIFDYYAMVVLHMWCGAIWLMIIPFTRASHMFLFPLTRAYMGCEFGLVRNARDW